MSVSLLPSNTGSEFGCFQSARHFGTAILNLFQTGITMQFENSQSHKGQSYMPHFTALHLLLLGPLKQRQCALYSTACSPAEVVIGGQS